MKKVENTQNINTHPYYSYNAVSSSGNNFDTYLEEETIIYAKAESDNTHNITDSTSFNEKAIQIPSQLNNIFKLASQRYGISEHLLKAVAKTESNFNPNATSRAGAMGVMQLMPDTAAYLGVSNAYDPEENIMGGAKYLAQLLHTYNNDISITLAAYNAGPGNVERYGGIPPFNETQHYVKKVLSYLEKNDFTYSDSYSATSSEQDYTYITAKPDTSTNTTQPDVNTVYAIAASDVTNPTKLYL